MAPGIFRPGLTLRTRGLKYGFQGTIYAKNLQKIAFRLTTGACKLRRGGYSPLALNGTTNEHILKLMALTVHKFVNQSEMQRLRTP